MSRILLASAQEDFDFPLAEATRKQILAQAERFWHHGHQVSVLIISPKRQSYTVHGGVPIWVVPRRQLWCALTLCARHERLVFFGSSGLTALVLALVMPLRERTLVFTDGELYSIGSNAGRRRALLKFAAPCYHTLGVYSDYQSELLRRDLPGATPKVIRIKPIVGAAPIDMSVSKSSRPRLLYMGHLSAFKGVATVLDCFEGLLGEIDGLELVLACNGLDYGSDLGRRIDDLRGKFGDRVIIKNKVDPLRELQRAHLYLYPLKQHAGTFAFPFSLYESLVAGTPFLAGKLASVREFFDDSFLCEPEHPDEFIDRARAILTGKVSMQLAIESNLQRLQKVVIGAPDQTREAIA
ncbi:MAG: glycosyltransferase [bacterium]